MDIHAADITGVVGIIPSPATDDAEDWRATSTVNLKELEKLVEAVIDAGVNVIMTTGTFGECATLLQEELRDLVACAVETTAGRRPVFAGITTLNTRETIRRARELIAVGADGLFVGRPMWLAMDDVSIVRYYSDIAEALPGVPQVVYDNPPAFKGKISAEAYLRLSDIPEVVAAKHVGGPQLESDMVAAGDRLRVLPNAPDWYRVAEAQPELAAACWSGAVACAPSAMVTLARAIARRDWQEAARVSERINWAEAPMFMGAGLGEFINYSIQLGHVRFRNAGLIDPGPCRPPYLSAPDDYAQGSAECGRRWAELEREFSCSALS